ncbi:hypothetical protein EHI8A_011620 [Entamoeba histolytica HM-1:IMSS-B]|uniref:TLDc domain-containing protein n=6 Tax=Entamoeba histolytica TaxID=5759 RepID=C4LUU4_ENTH1|nr:hypothetical protein EHI_178800 [Entamoeba histolytica HM-1:IMSS]EMD49054.1 Hypothetical protein EHI5A_008310 [Entamoeba histolytica KU27]EMH72753.1 hypothetical protein EHI8A_011620 [Entamoeba histolytica HM-1:IMSS-B]EMS17416.1 hypothetical protein KM1_037010 [Entamoeba histolytica HM-3:IMSS]ENY61454.1 hypothetical protein EHI7A_015210 [Entamoeba histolytica HM-1:IMSS-A]EAL50859.1 hypothetical protein EHI_178800 [Entamoeba histolytica HM-1:IMSS]|eukprot:XP_656244.1 hypothetical protein EHI_178800 [Entamoeba histolytica HM-1:IMSS]
MGNQQGYIKNHNSRSGSLGTWNHVNSSFTLTVTDANNEKEKETIIVPKPKKMNRRSVIPSIKCSYTPNEKRRSKTGIALDYFESNSTSPLEELESPSLTPKCKRSYSVSSNGGRTPRSSKKSFCSTGVFSHRSITPKITKMLTPKHSPRYEEEDIEEEYLSEKFEPVSPAVEMVSNIIDIKTYDILFDSRFDPLDNRTFNSKIIGHSKILVIIATSDFDIFGIYNEEVIPPFKKKGNINLETTQKFFLFTYNNNTQQIIHRKKNNTKSLTLYYENDSPFILTVFSAFWILSDGTCSIHQGFKNNYACTPCINPFSSQQTARKINAQFIFVIECH